MRNFYFWMLTLLCSTLMFGQLSENFESDITDRGWSLYQTGADDPGFVITDQQSHNGNYSYYHADDFLLSPSTSYMVSPAYTVQSGDALSVYVRQQHIEYYDYSGIMISTSSGDPLSNPDAFTEVWEASDSFAVESWEEVALALDSYIGESIYVAFVYEGEFSHQFYVDQFYIGATCDAPEATSTAIASCETNEFSVELNITNLGTATSVLVTDHLGNTQTANATGSLSFGPYESGSTATFTLADENNASCNIILTSTYLCAPDNDDCSTATEITSFPYNGSEDATGATQENFVSCGVDGSNDGVWYSFVGESAQYTVNVTSNNWDSAVSVLAGACGDLSCVAFSDNVGSNAQESITFIGQIGVTYYINVGAYSSNVDLEEGTFELEVLYEEIPCGAPSNLTSQTTTDLSSEVTWQGNGENESYDLVWGETGFTPGASANATNLQSTNYIITQLTPETTYDVYVRGNCNPGLSEWVGPVTFTTLEEGAVLPGTDCIHPINVVSLPFNTTDNTNNYEDDYNGSPGTGCGSTSSYLNGDDVVYAFTPEEDTSINISMTPTSTYSGIFVYDNCSNIGVSCIAGVANGSTTERSIDQLTLQGGQTYYIVISTWASPQSTAYTLNITENTCVSGSIELNAVSDCENQEYNVEVVVNDMGDLESYVVTDDQGSDAQTITSAGTYTFGPYAEGNEVNFNFEANDENCNEILSINYNCPATNDDCSDAIPIQCGETLSGNTEFATPSGLATTCGTYTSSDARDLFYSFEANGLNDYIVSVTNSPGTIFDAVLFVYSGECGDLVAIECSDSGNPEQITLLAPAAGTYYARVFRYSGVGDFDISLECIENTCAPATYEISPSAECVDDEFYVYVDFSSMGTIDTYVLTDDQGNPSQTITEVGEYTFGPYMANTEVTIDFVADDTSCNISETITYRCPAPGEVCENSLIVGSLPFVAVDSTSNYLDDYDGSPGSGCGSTSNYLSGDDVVYSYTPENDTSINIHLDSSSNYAGVFLYESCADIGTACLDGAVNGFSGGEISIEEIPVMSGQTYYIVISTWTAPQSTDYTLTITENTCTDGEFELTAIGACDTNEYNVEIAVSSMGTLDSYEISDDQGGVAQTITEEGTYTFGPYPSTQLVTFNFVANDANCNATESINFFCPAANDECADSIEVPVNPDFSCELFVTGSTLGATASPQEDDVIGTPNNDVWFDFVATSTSHRISLLNVVHLGGGTSTSIDLAFGLYDATSGCEALVLVDDSDPNVANFTGLTVGTTYVIRVYNYFATTSNIAFDVCIGTPPPPPANEVCDGAIALECNAEPVTYSSESSTATAPEGCAIGRNGIWFSFEGTGADITINSTATFDHEMSIHTGSCDELTWIACRDGSIGPESYTVVNTIPGQIYYVYVAHYSSSSTTTGNITIGIECAVVPECTLPELTLEAQDATGETLECVEEDGEYYVLATLSGGEGNDNYTLSDGTTDVTVIAGGTHVFGPYDASTNVSITATGVEDSDCIITESINSPGICPDTFYVTCDQPLMDQTYCYGSNELVEWLFTNPSGEPLQISFSAGTLEGNSFSGGTWDDLIIYDGINANGIVLFNSDDLPANSRQDLTGLSFVAESGNLFVWFDSDFSTSCSNNDTIYPWVYSVECYVAPECDLPELTLSAQDATGQAIDDCIDFGSEYYVLATLTGGDGNDSYSVSANGGEAVEVDAEDSVVFGPFLQGTEVNVHAIGIQDADCVVSISISSPIACPPSNDECEGAIEVPVNPDYSCDLFVSGSTLGATESPQSGNDVVGTPNNDVWFEFVATNDEHRISLLNVVNLGGGGAGTDMAFAVYDATGGCDALVLVDDSDPNVLNLSGLTEGTTYLIRVYNYSSTIGNHSFDVCIGTPPPPLPTEYDVECGTPVEISYCYDHNDLFDWTFTSTSGEPIEIIFNAGTLEGRASGGTWDDMRIYDGTDETGTLLFDSDDLPGDSRQDLTGLSFVGNSGSIFLWFDSDGSVSCSNNDTIHPWDITVSCVSETPEAPINDECEGATELIVGENFEENMLVGTNFGATANDMDNPTCGNYDGGDVWYTVTVPENGVVYVETQSSGEVSNTGMAAYTGTCGNLVEFMCEADDTGFAMISASDLTPGEIVFIRVWSNDGSVGSFNISAWTDPMSVVDYAGAKAVKIYPNPTADLLNISGIEVKDVQVYAASGQLAKVRTSNNVVDTRGLQSGTYIIRITDNEGNVVLRKFIKK